MMCHRIGFSPMSTSGFGMFSVTSRRRVPIPPHRITTGISETGSGVSGISPLQEATAAQTLLAAPALPGRATSFAVCTLAAMAPDGQLRVAAFPAGRPGMSNPYAALFAGALRAQGAIVNDVPFAALFRTRYDVVHVHWPEWVLDARSSRRALVMLAALAWARRRGTRVVWTVHNLGHHEQTSRRAWAWNRFARMVDAFFSLTERGVDAARDAFPQLRDTPAFVVPHGHYRDAYPNTVTRDEARAHLGISPDARVALFFG